MLTVKIIAVGKLKENYLTQACEEYQKRLSSHCQLAVIEIEEYRLPDAPSQALIEQALRKEGEKILDVAKKSVIIALCIEGKALTSPELSQRIQSMVAGGTSSLSFVIGGSFGLSDQVKEAAELRLSMSAMTFPHQLARVLLLEQLYRAFSISTGGKYHK